MNEREKEIRKTEEKLKKIQMAILIKNHGSREAADEYIASRNRHITAAMIRADRADLTKFSFKDTDMLVTSNGIMEPDRWSWAFHAAMDKLVNASKMENGHE